MHDYWKVQVESAYAALVNGRWEPFAGVPIKAYRPPEASMWLSTPLTMQACTSSMWALAMPGSILLTQVSACCDRLRCRLKGMMHMRLLSMQLG